jgi:hypothetical protein
MMQSYVPMAAVRIHDFRRTDGLDALEQRFEENGIEYRNPLPMV